MSIISRRTAEHYTWGKVCDGWRLVGDAALSVIEEAMPPGSQEVRHYHQKAQQFFYILSGEATMETNAETLRLRAGEGIRILPGMRHRILNESSEEVRFLVISQPPSHGDRVNQ
jgi:mannose-6-phosphate isomerase-like protein (cupin superfamily)